MFVDPASDEHILRAKISGITVKPTIIIFIEGKLVDGNKGFVCSTIVRLVTMIKFYQLAKTFQFRELVKLDSHVYLFVFESFCCSWGCAPYHHLNTSLLLYFTTPVAILAVALRIFVPFIRAKSNCRFATVYTGRLERTRSNQTHIPSRFISEQFGMVWFN